MTVFAGARSSTDVDSPTLRPASLMAVLAAPFFRPTMSGTVTGLGPLLTVNVTVEPTSTSSPAAGSVLTASPAATEALLRSTVSTTRPSPSSVLCASAAGVFLTAGISARGGPALMDEVHGSALGHLRAGSRILAQDGAGSFGAIDRFGGADSQVDIGDGRLGRTLGGAHDIGHGHRLGTGADGEQDVGADEDRLAGGRLGPDGIPCGHGSVAALLGLDHEAEALKRRLRLSSRGVLDSRDLDGRRARAEGEVHARAGGQLGACDRVLTDDGVLGSRVFRAHLLADHETGVGDGGGGSALLGADDIGYHDRLGARADGEGDLGADVDGRAGSRLGLDGIAGSDAGVARFTSGDGQTVSLESSLGVAGGHVTDVSDNDLWADPS